MPIFEVIKLNRIQEKKKKNREAAIQRGRYKQKGNDIPSADTISNEKKQYMMTNAAASSVR